MKMLSLSESFISVPGVFAQPGTEYVFSVSVKNRDSDWVNGTQKIKVVQGATIVTLM